MLSRNTMKKKNLLIELNQELELLSFTDLENSLDINDPEEKTSCWRFHTEGIHYDVTKI